MHLPYLVNLSMSNTVSHIFNFSKKKTTKRKRRSTSTDTERKAG